MKLEMTGRHVEITPALREFAQEKLAKLERLLDGPVDAHVVLEIEKHRHIAEIQVKARALALASSFETGDLYASIGEVADRLERLALKHKQKRRGSKHRVSPRDPDVAAEIGAKAARVAAEIDETGDHELDIQRTPRALSDRPLTAAAAARRLRDADAPVLMYRDEGTRRLCVVYRLDDGGIGLVESDT